MTGILNAIGLLILIAGLVVLIAGMLAGLFAETLDHDVHKPGPGCCIDPNAGNDS